MYSDLATYFSYRGFFIIWLVNWKTAEWFEIFNSIVPETDTESTVFVRMLSIQVLAQCGCWWVDIEISGVNPDVMTISSKF